MISKFHGRKLVDRIASISDPADLIEFFSYIRSSSPIRSKTSLTQMKNEEWIVRSIPSSAKLIIRVYCKDDTQLSDDCLGIVEIREMINGGSHPHDHLLIDRFGCANGRFHLSIQMMKALQSSEPLPQYTFDGPCRFSRHDFSYGDSSYSIWRIDLRRISTFFPSDGCQSWNRQYQAARNLFYDRRSTKNVKEIVRRTHRVLDGKLNTADDLWSVVFLDIATQLIQPRIYNYIIDQNSWHFSETGPEFFGSTVNKHALLANCSESIRLAGEFHLRPKSGWHRLDDKEWELVFDNASGTYSAIAALLNNLKQLLEFNFPGLHISTYDYKDPRLQESVEQLEIAKKNSRYKTRAKT